MLTPTMANRYAHQLLDARAKSLQISPLSAAQTLSLEEGYQIANCIRDIRVAQGEVPVGRKIGFTNRQVASKYGVTEPIGTPIWAYMFDTTVRFADDNRGIQSLAGAVQPRIEPEIVFKLATAPAADATLDELADCIEWIAHGIEIAVCPFPDWKFDTADAVAAFGLHGTMIIGEPKVLATTTRHNLADMLANSSVSLSTDVALRTAGFGSDMLDSPVHALLHLHQALKMQSPLAPLAAGEVIATGTWTDPCPIEARQTWTSAFSGISLQGLTISLV